MSLVGHSTTHDLIIVMSTKLPDGAFPIRDQCRKVDIDPIVLPTILVRHKERDTTVRIPGCNGKQVGITSRALIGRATSLEGSNCHTHCIVVGSARSVIAYQSKGERAIIIQRENMASI